MNRFRFIEKTKRIRLPPGRLTMADLRCMVQHSFGLPRSWRLVFHLNDGSKARMVAKTREPKDPGTQGHPAFSTAFAHGASKG